MKPLGPGLVTGAADDDPSGIATYSQTGAQFGYGMLWTVIFAFPLMVAIQEASARIGAVTGHGLSGVIKKHYSSKLLYSVVFLVLFANIINIGADIGAMAAAANLIIPINFTYLAIFFAVTIVILEVFISYKNYATILKYLSFALLSYFITVFIVSEPWGEILRATFVPHIEFTPAFLFIAVGVLGTTISPYLFFWEASQEVEEERENKKRVSGGLIKRLRIDNFLGMLASQITTWSIIVVAATVLHKSGVTSIKTAADAARALEPLVVGLPNAGAISKLLFAFGVVVLGFLAVPVLAGSAAYAVSEAMGWKEGLNLKLSQARGFYGVIATATFVGFGINLIGIDPIRALIYTAVINGLVSVPLIFIIGKIAASEDIMGKYKSGLLSKLFVSAAFLTMFGVVIALGASFLV